MLDWIVALIPTLPLLAASLLGFSILLGRLEHESDEARSAGLVSSTIGLSFGLACLSLILRHYGLIDREIVLGTWLDSGNYHVRISLLADTLSLGLAILFSGLVLLVTRFSIHYLHREPAFHRFFLILALFAGAMLCMVLGGNLVMTFLGWELAGVSSYLLIAYAHERPVAAAHATQAFITNRIGDMGFGIAIFLAYSFTGDVEWSKILAILPDQGHFAAGSLALCLLWAAMAKSALVPFSPWLARALEGPTPSSALFYGAVMVHSGVFLVLRLEPLFTAAPWAMAIMAGVGLVTAVYGFLCGLTQSDVKSSLIFSTTSQIGLMFLMAGLGAWQWAYWHLIAHAVFRGLQFLNSPSLMHQTLNLSIRPPPPLMARQRWLYKLSLRRFWLEEGTDNFLIKPCLKLASDCHRFDNQVVDRSIGWPAPALKGLSTLAQWEEQRLGVSSQDPRPGVRGLPAYIIHTVGTLLHWFEEQLVLRGIGQDMMLLGRRLGSRLNHIEQGLAEPRYWLLWIIITLLITL